MVAACVEGQLDPALSAKVAAIEQSFKHVWQKDLYLWFRLSGKNDLEVHKVPTDFQNVLYLVFETGGGERVASLAELVLLDDPHRDCLEILAVLQWPRHYLVLHQVLLKFGTDGTFSCQNVSKL